MPVAVVADKDKQSGSQATVNRLSDRVRLRCRYPEPRIFGREIG